MNIANFGQVLSTENKENNITQGQFRTTLDELLTDKELVGALKKLSVE